MKKIFYFISIIILTPLLLLAEPKAVIFDYGEVMTGVLNRELIATFICQSMHLSKEQYEKVNEERRLAVAQGMTDEEFWITYASKQGICLPANWLVSFKSKMKDAINVNPRMYLLVDELRELPITVGLLSNIDARLARVIRDFGGYQPFDPCLLSYELGVEKPHLEIYEILLKRLQLPAHEVVFIDDKRENVEAALILGIDAILFISEDQLRKELVQRKLLVPELSFSEER